MEKEKPNLSEDGGEDIYGDPVLFPDYDNECQRRVGIDDEGKIWRDGHVRTVEERYLTGKGADGYGEPYKEMVKNNPKRVERINKIAYILNTTEDVTTFKRAYNELQRVIRGRIQRSMGKEMIREQFYSGQEFNPDLLEIQ